MAVLRGAGFIVHTKDDHDEAARRRRNLARRAERRGVKPAVQAQREWIKANPCGFEVRGDGDV